MRLVRREGGGGGEKCNCGSPHLLPPLPSTNAAVISWSSALLFVYLNFCLPLIVFLRQSRRHGHDSLPGGTPRPGLSAQQRSDGADWLLADEDSDDRGFVASSFLKGSLQLDSGGERGGGGGVVGGTHGGYPHAACVDGVGGENDCDEEETVAATLRVVPHVPCVPPERQPSTLGVATGLLVVTSLLAVACFAMQIGQVAVKETVG